MDDARALAGRLRDAEAEAAKEAGREAAKRICEIVYGELDRRKSDRLAAPEGVGLTRYGKASNGMMLKASNGPWVRHEDAAAALAAEKARGDGLEALRVARTDKLITERDAAEADRDALKAALAGLTTAVKNMRAPQTTADVGLLILVFTPLLDAADAALSKTQGGG